MILGEKGLEILNYCTTEAGQQREITYITIGKKTFIESELTKWATSHKPVWGRKELEMMRVVVGTGFKWYDCFDKHK